MRIGKANGLLQKISYSKNRSDTLAKLTGTFNQPAPKTDAAQQALTAPTTFAAIPGAAPAPGTAAPAANGATAKAGADVKEDVLSKAEAPVAPVAGTKRPRDEQEEEEDEEEAEMEVEDEEMEMSEGDDD